MLEFYLPQNRQDIAEAAWINKPAPAWVSRAEPKSTSPFDHLLTYGGTGVHDSFGMERSRELARSTTIKNSSVVKQATNEACHRTLTISEFSATSKNITSAPPTHSEHIQGICGQRVRLLAEKYAHKTKDDGFAEIQARLQILNSRLAKQQPLVTLAQVGALENATEQLNILQQSREAFVARLNAKKR